MADEPGRLLGRGRAADVFELGDGLVLRRYRDPGRADRTAAELTAMRHLAGAGFPVPRAEWADGADLAMERLHGVTMLAALQRRPWRYRRYVDVWADLLARLASVPVAGLADVLPMRFGPPGSVLHLDLHPDNIMLTARGPVVFDWTNVALGPAAADVAQSWLLAASSTVEESRLIGLVAARLRRRIVDRLVDHCGRDAAAALLPAVGAERLRDPHVRPEEADRIRRLVAQSAPAPTAPGDRDER